MSTNMPTASYTARCEMAPMSALTTSTTSSAVRCGRPDTARSTARRCAVTLKPCCRRTSAGSAVISATFANLHPLVKSTRRPSRRGPQILVCVKISGDRSPEILTQTLVGRWVRFGVWPALLIHDGAIRTNSISPVSRRSASTATARSSTGKRASSPCFVPGRPSVGVDVDDEALLTAFAESEAAAETRAADAALSPHPGRVVPPGRHGRRRRRQRRVGRPPRRVGR